MIFIFVKNLIQYDAIHNFSLWLIPVLIHWILIGFEAILENKFQYLIILQFLEMTIDKNQLGSPYHAKESGRVGTVYCSSPQSLKITMS